MKIEHLAIYVKNLDNMRSFYCQYFGGVSNQRYENPVTGLQSYFLSFSDGARVELMTRPGTMPAENYEYTLGLAHLAFDVGSREEVDSLTSRLENDGYTVSRCPRVTGEGYYESVILDPEGNRIEITGS
jgi:lactoylglutathione lyase